MKKISTGQDSTLRTYRDIAFVMGGFEYNKAVEFFEQKSRESILGLEEEVIADERQMLLLIHTLINEKGSE